MEYPRFVRLRSPLWDELEAGLERARERPKSLSHADLEALAFRYRQALHDHALAAARFPGTSAARRLRRLSLAGTRFLVREQESRARGLVAFFTRSFPAALSRQRSKIALAAGLFVLGSLFGLAVTVIDPALGQAFLGPEALAGLEEGRLWTEALTTTVPPSASSSWIATNNVSVALTAWAGGAAAGLLAFYALLLNGVMLGSVIGVTLHYSMTAGLLEFIAAHGPLELTIIVVAAGGGLTLGWGLVADSDRPRDEVLAEATRDALVILGGCLPWLVLLALVESFVSPSPDYSPALKLTLGLALEGLFLTLVLRPFPPRRGVLEGAGREPAVVVSR